MPDSADLPLIPIADPIDTALPGPQEIVTAFTFDAPNVLLSAVRDGGFDVLSVRSGRAVQVPLTTHVEWSDEPVDERERVFSVGVTNRVNFAGKVLDMINDEVEYGEVRLPGTKVTAAAYLGLVGSTVLIHFECSRDLMQSARLGRPVFKIVRNTIVLP